MNTGRAGLEESQRNNLDSDFYTSSVVWQMCSIIQSAFSMLVARISSFFFCFIDNCDSIHKRAYWKKLSDW